LKEGNKSDRIDARKLAEMLRTNQLHSVYHGEHGMRTLKELGRSYLTVTKDVTHSPLPGVRDPRLETRVLGNSQMSAMAWFQQLLPVCPSLRKAAIPPIENNDFTIGI
jgi:hypothetical protein